MWYATGSGWTPPRVAKLVRVRPAGCVADRLQVGRMPSGCYNQWGGGGLDGAVCADPSAPPGYVNTVEECKHH